MGIPHKQIQRNVPPFDDLFVEGVKCLRVLPRVMWNPILYCLMVLFSSHWFEIGIWLPLKLRRYPQAMNVNTFNSSENKIVSSF